ncbi:MAG: YceI family protein [Acidobacteria bacterium]|nr:YceI family protein [Acidobacteriota bacterium]
MRFKTIKRFIVLFGSLLLMSLAASAQNSRTYTIAAGESSLWVFVGKSGFLSALAHDHEIGVKSFTGRVVVPEAGASGGSLELDIETKSFVVLDKKVSEEDRTKIFNAMHSEVIESAKYQQITFKSSSVSDLKKTGEGGYSFVLNGDLTLHGVTKRIAVPVTATITPQQLRAVGKYTLKQTDYGIKVYSAGGGTIKVKNDIVINFDIVAKA